MKQIGTPQVTADGSDIHVGGRVWYATPNSTQTDFQMRGGEVVGIRPKSINIQLWDGFIDKVPDELFADPVACLTSKLPQGDSHD